MGNEAKIIYLQKNTQQILFYPWSLQKFPKSFIFRFKLASIRKV